MSKTYIDKLAYIYLKDGRVLSTVNHGKNTWWIPGGKREGNETDQQTLIREVKEELSIDLIPETIKHYGTFEAQAHGKPEGTVGRMTCYTADFTGDLAPAAEVAKIGMLTYDYRDKSSPVDQIIFDDLKARGLLE